MIISNLVSLEIQQQVVEIEYSGVGWEDYSKLSNPFHGTANSVPTLRLQNLKFTKILWSQSSTYMSCVCIVASSSIF